MPTKNSPETLAQVVMPTKDLPEDMAFFSKMGFRLDNIFPADDPAVALMSGHGMNIRIDKNTDCPPPRINILSDNVEGTENIAPNGTVIKVLLKMIYVMAKDHI